MWELTLPPSLSVGIYRAFLLGCPFPRSWPECNYCWDPFCSFYLILASRFNSYWRQENTHRHTVCLYKSFLHIKMLLKQTTVGTMHAVAPAGKDCIGYSVWFDECKYCAAAFCQCYDWKHITNNFLLPYSHLYLTSFNLVRVVHCGNQCGTFESYSLQKYVRVQPFCPSSLKEEVSLPLMINDALIKVVFIILYCPESFF